MASQRTLMKVMGITFILIGIIFFVLGLLMLIMMGYVSASVASLGAFGIGGGQLGALNTFLTIGWIFSIITFAAGLFSIITAILLFITKE